ncbi:DOPA-like domain-containing protein [Hypoxylon fragiforme]|uniref:DOPA-like domain-containing protein n=1 Tax=Hypoxylon fragiforme TaxID=63214 RepID=UPI0020C5BABC|nr:DOPA-like domain-containing protein [Hypoxylon fragiforme]KAI2609935.1 DOPA-like domain-containing protein [Hypoxylon fragiforme]
MGSPAERYTYPSPLAGFENAPPLPDEKNEDGKSFKNPPRDILSEAYTTFPEPLENGRRGAFDVHIYYFSSNKAYAKELWERIRREFPELRIYRFWDHPVGPHPVAMFEVNIFTPAQFGAFIPWLAIYRGPLSVLIHPNTVEGGEGVSHMDVERRNHSQRAIWMGERIPLDLDLFYAMGS